MPVVPTLNQDYPAWHLGREHYALWYLEILDPDLLAYLATLREHFSDILYTPNTRQFHITLFICGFFNALNTADAILAAEKVNITIIFPSNNSNNSSDSFSTYPSRIFN